MDIEKLRTLNNPVIEIDSKLIQDWDKIVNTEFVKNNISPTEISQAVGNSYIGNFFGLLSNELNIPMDVWVPTMIINNLTNPLDYKGDRKIYIISPDTIDAILGYMKQKKK